MDKRTQQAILEHYRQNPHLVPPWIQRSDSRYNPNQLSRTSETAPNQKCPCGSGRKFKKCCMYAGIENEPTEAKKEVREVQGQASQETAGD